MLRLFACLALLLVGTTPSTGQQRIFALVPRPLGVSTSLWEARVENGQVVDAAPLTTVRGGSNDVPRVTAGGQFVVWTTSLDPSTPVLVAFDRTTGVTHLVPGAVTLGVSDPTGPRLFIPVANQIGQLTPAGFALIPNTTGLRPVGVSLDGLRVHAVRLVDGPPASYELVIVNANTGALLSTTPVGTQFFRLDGNEAFAWAAADTPSGPVLRKVAVPSGDVALAVALPSSGFPYPPSYRVPAIDDVGHRVFVSHAIAGSFGSFGNIRSFDTEDGTEGPTVPLVGPGAIAHDPGSATILSFSQPRAPGGACGEAVIQTLFATTGIELTRFGVGSSDCMYVAFGVAPRPPVLNPAIITGRTVTLSWTASPELTTGSRVEAGDAPGRSNIASLPVTSGTSLVAQNVPPGTYYVRVRASNHIGQGSPSNEVIVTVP